MQGAFVPERLHRDRDWALHGYHAPRGAASPLHADRRDADFRAPPSSAHGCGFPSVVFLGTGVAAQAPNFGALAENDSLEQVSPEGESWLSESC
jgi:hypothetical protein